MQDCSDSAGFKKHFTLLTISSLERVFVDPVEAAIDQHKFIAVQKLQLHLHLMAIHGAIQNKLVWRGASVSKAGLPDLVCAFGQSNRMVFFIDGCPISGEDVIRPLE